MRKYSDFFQTLHDEEGPTGYLGPGTHYSVLRAIVFHTATGHPLQRGRFVDFAIIWDEDHDERVIEPIEKIYLKGHLSRFLMFGERRGVLTAVQAPDESSNAVDVVLVQWLEKITQQVDQDAWRSRVVSLQDPNPIIEADSNKVTKYLENLMMLWELGVKFASIDDLPFSPVLLQRVDQLQLLPNVALKLRHENITHLGDLVQKHEVEVYRMPNMGPKTLNHIKEALEQIGLRFGTQVVGWPPRNISHLGVFLADADISTKVGEETAPMG